MPPQSATPLERDSVLLCLAAPREPSPAGLALLSGDEAARAARFHFTADRHRFQSTRILLRRLLSAHCGSHAPADWRFVLQAGGRPELAPGQTASPVHFNVSHARSTIACILSGNPLCGVDVEDRVPDDFRMLVDRFFAQDERAWIAQAVTASEAGQRFLTLWTLKEAWLKARGTGLATDLRDFSILPSGVGRYELSTGSALEAEPSAWHFHHATLPDGAHLAIAMRQRDGLWLKAVTPPVG